MCIFSYWIYVGPGCIIVHLLLTIVVVCVDPSGGGEVCVAGYVHVCEPPTLKCLLQLYTLPCWAALEDGTVPVQLPLASDPNVEVAPVRGVHVSVGSPF